MESLYVYQYLLCILRLTAYLLMLYVYIFRMVYMGGDAEAHINPRAQ